MDNNDLIYLDTYILQKDMRVRLPKCVLENLDLEQGQSRLRIYITKDNSQIVLEKDESSEWGEL
ncbi:MAG: sucrose-6-phosphate hydrolase [Finegoldia magna]|uniref:sucrose-6-phosphate hydrolase n=1 Tax=Finegoldia magna TaxID=1260 RepID=UPI003993A518